MLCYLDYLEDKITICFLPELNNAQTFFSVNLKPTGRRFGCRISFKVFRKLIMTVKGALQSYWKVVVTIRSNYIRK